MWSTCNSSLGIRPPDHCWCNCALAKIEKSEDPLERARIATVMAALDHPEFLAQVAAIDLDQSDRTLLICNICDWIRDQQLPLTILQETGEACVQSAMLGAISLQDQRRVNREAIRQVVDELYRNSADSGVHGYARAVANRYQWPLSRVLPSSPDTNWNVIPDDDLTFVRIPAGQLVVNSGAREASDPDAREILSIESFWLCDREVTRALYLEFLHDPEYPDDQKPEPDSWPDIEASEAPVYAIEAAEARMFCNWLSWKHRLDDYYSLVDGVWSVNEEANGFRLPTWPELEYACRCGGTTALHIGQVFTDELLVNFENKVDRSLGSPRFVMQETGQRLPNAWGLFDTHGNVGELCLDPDNDKSWARGLIGENRVHHKDRMTLRTGEDEVTVDVRRQDVGFRVAIDNLQ